jgi:hypothetical protein
VRNLCNARHPPDAAGAIKEVAYEVRFGQWQDTNPKILLCVML